MPAPVPLALFSGRTPQKHGGFDTQVCSAPRVMAGPAGGTTQKHCILVGAIRAPLGRNAGFWFEFLDFLRGGASRGADLPGFPGPIGPRRAQGAGSSILSPVFVAHRASAGVRLPTLTRIAAPGGRILDSVDTRGPGGARRTGRTIATLGDPAVWARRGPFCASKHDTSASLEPVLPAGVGVFQRRPRAKARRQREERALAAQKCRVFTRRMARGGPKLPDP